ncbi:unnamed protein product [Staurois parvus]|uniref:Uncharacterized protein n=1 Tax=Staurois parvus TaxID=386267 RepID=A0ABN9AD91_9NEOB|nr:unnamed protein product [Staurois parvus]
MSCQSTPVYHAQLHQILHFPVLVNQPQDVFTCLFVFYLYVSTTGQSFYC